MTVLRAKRDCVDKVTVLAATRNSVFKMAVLRAIRDCVDKVIVLEAIRNSVFLGFFF